MDGCNIIRPFYPGGDYLAENYRDNDFVFDNPPFSILSKIIDNYIALGVKFFLFAPHLTLFQYGGRDVSLFVVDADVIYENGARVKTDFVTNIADRGGRLEIRKEACQRIKTVNGSKGNSIFGGGFLISDNAVLDKEAAEREAAEREATIQIQLSKTELRIISKLNKNDQRADS